MSCVKFICFWAGKRSNFTPVNFNNSSVKARRLLRERSTQKRSYDCSYLYAPGLYNAHFQFTL